MLMAGATAVGVGSALYYGGVTALTQIRDEMTAWLVAHGHADLAAIRGAAHREPVYLSTPTGAPVPG